MKIGDMISGSFDKLVIECCGNEKRCKIILNSEVIHENVDGLLFYCDGVGRKILLTDNIVRGATDVITQYGEDE
jgi:hypothetical protein